VVAAITVDSAYSVGTPSSDTVTITDDGDPPEVSVTATDPNAVEPSDNGEFTFSRSGPTSGALDVFYTISGSATAGSDYTTLTGLVTIPDGQATATETVIVIDDGETEPPETVVVAISPNGAYNIGTPSTDTVTILDDDVPDVSVVASDPDAAEPADNGLFTFSRTGPTTNPLTVNYTVTGTATAGSDYIAIAGSVTIPGGLATAPETVAVLDDVLAEGDETVVVTITADPAYAIDPAASSGTVTIADDGDPPEVAVEATDRTAAEPADDGQFTFSRAGPTVNPLTVNYTVTGTATPGNDYTPLTGTMIIPGGAASATETVAVLDDFDTEAPETVVVTITVNPAYAIDPAAGVDTVTITDNDGIATLEVRVAAGSDDAEERNSGSVRLNSSDLELIRDKTNDQIVGVRFPGITIPPGAGITKAWIQFQSDETDTIQTDLTIRAQDSDDAATFVNTTGDISTRPVTTALSSWSPPAWETVGVAGPDQRTPDLSALVQEVVNRSGWQSGNALAFIVTGSGTRVAEAYDGIPGAAPLLHIEYSTGPLPNRPPVAQNDSVSAVEETPATIDVASNDFDPDGNLDPATANTSCDGCSEPVFGLLVNDGDGVFTYTADPGSAANGIDTFVYEICDLEGACDVATVTITIISVNAPTIIEVRIGSGADDAEERPSGSVSLNSSDLELIQDGSKAQVVGVRFPGITIPQGATITNAYVQFQADETSNVQTDLVIRAEAADDAVAFVNTTGNISSRPTTGMFELWSPPAWNVRGEAGHDQQTPNLSMVIQEVTDRAGWNAGNAIVVIFTGTGSRVAESYNGFAAAAPLLHIEYTTAAPGESLALPPSQSSSSINLFSPQVA
jgi:hypothetical protein